MFEKKKSLFYYESYKNEKSLNLKKKNKKKQTL